MLYFATRMRCPHCSHVFNVWFEAEAPPDSDARYLVRCPENASSFVLPLSVFKPVEAPPTPGAKAKRTTKECNEASVAKWLRILDLPPESPPPTPPSKPPPSSPPKAPWWQFWKRP